jgi:hypothetical protein
MQTLPNQDLEAVLSRSYQVGVYQWRGDQATHTNIFNTNNALDLFVTNHPNIVTKLAYYNFFRCKGINFTIRLNSTPWHYGCLALSSTVNNSQDWSNTLVNSDQYMNNRTMLLDANVQDSVDYSVPWAWYHQWVRTPVQGRTIPPTNAFRMTVASQLSMIGDSVIPVRVSLFMNLIEPEVTFPFPWNSISEDLFAQSSFGESHEKSVHHSTVSGSTDSITSVINSASDIADLLGKLAPLAAMLDKPSTKSVHSHVSQYPGTDQAHVDGLDMSFTLAGHSTASLAVEPGVAGDAIEQFTLQQVQQAPGFIRRFLFNRDTAAGALLSQWNVTPLELPPIRGTNRRTPTPLCWYSVPFRLWRGSIKYHIHFVASAFMTARLRIVYFPPDVAIPATISDSFSGDFISQVVEVVGSMDHCFTVPYIHTSVWKTTGFEQPDSTTFNLNSVRLGAYIPPSSIGQIAIYLLAPLVCVDSALVPRIEGLVWAAAAEDFQVANYASLYANGVGPQQVRLAPLPAGDSLEAQCSIVDSFSRPFQPIVTASHFQENRVAVSEQFTDLVSLAKRYSTLTTMDKNSPAPSVPYIGSPASIMPTGNADWSNIQSWILACFVNFRGSMRYKIIADTMPLDVDDSTPSFVNLYVKASCPSFITAGIANPLNVGNPTTSADFTPTLMTITNGYAEFTIPYNSTNPWQSRNYQVPWLENNSFALWRSFPTKCKVLLSLGDDFMVGVFQAPPLMTLSAVPGDDVVPPPVKVRENSKVPVHRND